VIGPQYATSCNAAYLAWTSARYAWTNPNPIYTTITSTYAYITYESSSTISVFNTSFPTQCDGLKRLPNYGADYSADISYFALDPPITSVETWSVTRDISNKSFSDPFPSCSINVVDCRGLNYAYSLSDAQADASWSSENVLTISLASPPALMVVNGITTPLADPSAPTLTLHGFTYPPLPGPSLMYSLSNATNLFAPVTLIPGGVLTASWDGDYLFSFRPGPYCDPHTELITSQDMAECKVKNKCTITASNVELMYFAPPATSRDLCASTTPGYNQFSVSDFSQPHLSTVINGSTFWSDSVYVKYDTLGAFRMCDDGFHTVGHPQTGQIVALQSSQISSLCGWRITRVLAHEITVGATPVPFNFDDLEGPVPASAYNCMIWCQGSCTAIVQKSYMPVLAVPDQVRSLDPEWNDCVPFWGGSYDPPTAIGSALVAADPTSIVPIFSPPPIPAVTPPPPGPPKTTTVHDRTSIQTWSRSHALPLHSQSSGPETPHDPSEFDPIPNRPHDATSHGNDGAKPSGLQGLPPNPTSKATPFATVGPTVILPDPSDPNGIVISGPSGITSMAVGATTTVNGQTVIAFPSGGRVISVITPQSTQSFPIAQSDQQFDEKSKPVAIASFGGALIFSDPSDPTRVIIMQDPSDPSLQMTLSPGANQIIVSGTTVSISPSGVLVVASNGHTDTVPLPTPPPSFSDVDAVATIANMPILVDPANPTVVTIAGSVVTLAPGSTLTTVIHGDTLTVYYNSKDGDLVIADLTSTQNVHLAMQNSVFSEVQTGGKHHSTATAIPVASPPVTENFSGFTSPSYIASDGAGATSTNVDLNVVTTSKRAAGCTNQPMMRWLWIILFYIMLAI
jgi:hypothetical protein